MPPHIVPSAPIQGSAGSPLIDAGIPANERAIVEADLAKLPLHTDNIQMLSMGTDGKIYSNRTALKAAARYYRAQRDGTMLDAAGHHFPLAPQLPRPDLRSGADAGRSPARNGRAPQTVYTPPNNQTNSGPYHELYGYTFDPNQGKNFNAYFATVYLPCYAMQPDSPNGPTPLDIGYIYTGGWSGNAGRAYVPTDFGLQYSSTYNDYSVYTLVDGGVLTSGGEGATRIKCGQWVGMEYGIVENDVIYVAITNAATQGIGTTNFSITRRLNAGSGWDFSCQDCVLKQVVSIGQLNLAYNQQGQLVNTPIPAPGYFADGEFFGTPSSPVRFSFAGLGECYQGGNPATTICGRDFASASNQQIFSNYNAVNPRGHANAPDDPSVINTGFEPTHRTAWDEQVSINVRGGPYVQSYQRGSGSGTPCALDPMGYCAVNSGSSSLQNWCTDYNGDQVNYTQTITTYTVYNSTGINTTYFYFETDDPSASCAGGWSPDSPAHYYYDPYLPQ